MFRLDKYNSLELPQESIKYDNIKCQASGCDKYSRYKTSKSDKTYCPMHLSRLKRNGHLGTQCKKDRSEKYRVIPSEILDKTITEHYKYMTDKEIASILQTGHNQVKTHHISYRRKQLGLYKHYPKQGKGYMKKQARLEYGDDCELCGYNLTVDIHHILEVKNGGEDSLDNLCVICPCCHALIHRGIIELNSREEISNTKLNLKKLLKK
jgi:hypothetical protein